MKKSSFCFIKTNYRLSKNASLFKHKNNPLLTSNLSINRFTLGVEIEMKYPVKHLGEILEQNYLSITHVNNENQLLLSSFSEL